jgi:hypothetical protein
MLIAIWQISHPARKKPPAVAAHQPQYGQDARRERGAPAALAARPKVAWDELMQKRYADGA